MQSWIAGMVFHGLVNTVLGFFHSMSFGTMAMIAAAVVVLIALKFNLSLRTTAVLFGVVVAALFALRPVGKPGGGGETLAAQGEPSKKKQVKPAATANSLLASNAASFPASGGGGGGGGGLPGMGPLPHSSAPNLPHPNPTSSIPHKAHPAHKASSGGVRRATAPAPAAVPATANPAKPAATSAVTTPAKPAIAAHPAPASKTATNPKVPAKPPALALGNAQAPPTKSTAPTLKPRVTPSATRPRPRGKVASNGSAAPSQAATPGAGGDMATASGPHLTPAQQKLHARNQARRQEIDRAWMEVNRHMDEMAAASVAPPIHGGHVEMHHQNGTHPQAGAHNPHMGGASHPGAGRHGR